MDNTHIYKGMSFILLGYPPQITSWVLHKRTTTTTTDERRLTQTFLSIIRAFRIAQMLNCSPFHLASLLISKHAMDGPRRRPTDAKVLYHS
jgi:hypothetical protein